MRKPISGAVQSLRHFKYKEIQIDFGEKLKEIESKVSEQDVIEKNIETSSVLVTESIHSGNNNSISPDPSDVNQIELLSHFNPHAAIFEAWALVEKEVQRAVMRFAISPDFPLDNSTSKNSRILLDNEYIDKNTYNVIQNLKSLRNSILYNDSKISISQSEVKEYADLARRISEKLSRLKRNQLYICVSQKATQYVHLLRAWGLTTVRLDTPNDKTAVTESLQKSISAAILKSQAVLCIVDSGTYQNQWVNWEIETARKFGKKIIATKVEPDCQTPDFLKQPHIEWTEFTHEALMKALDDHN